MTRFGATFAQASRQGQQADCCELERQGAAAPTRQRSALSGAQQGRLCLDAGARTIVSRARGFRPVLLGVILFWVCVFAAFAQATGPCAWAVTAGTGVGAGDVGYAYAWTGADFCAGRGVAGSGMSWATSTTCAQSGFIATVEFTDPGLGTYTVTGTGGACAAPPDPGEPDPWVELDLLHAIVGALWFFSLMHGFTVGRVST